MDRAAIAILACGVCACAQLFGLDDTTGPDAPPAPYLSLQVDHMQLGATIVTTPQDLQGQTAVYLVTDPAEPSGLRRVPAMLAANTWSAHIPAGSAAAVDYSLPEAVQF